jgi:hypothetical protein
LQFFDSATMLSLKYPSKHSAVRFCQQNQGYLEDDYLPELCGDVTGGHGYDPYTDNVPIDDLFVGKSQAGEHAGRGVYTKVDIPPNTYVGLETTVHSIIYEWTTTDLHNDLIDHVPVYSNAQGKIIYVFAEAYGYSQEPWNMPQEAVMSHMLTFLNHGCNGTSNIGDDAATSNMTEFTIDLGSDEVPSLFATRINVPYVPHFDRDHVKAETMCRSSRRIHAGEELYDNYLSFGGDSQFKEMVQMLRQECSGSFGMVEQYQKGETLLAETHDSGHTATTTSPTFNSQQSYQEEL